MPNQAQPGSAARLTSAQALKSELASRVVAALDRHGLTVREAQARTGQAAAEFSRLRGGQLERLTIERLLGRKVDLVELARYVTFRSPVASPNARAQQRICQRATRRRQYPARL